MTPLLELDSVSVCYGSLAAVSSVSLTLEPRSVLVVLGANGAGKSSLARATAGLVPLSGGRITLRGAEVSGTAPHRVRRQGVAYVPERGKETDVPAGLRGYNILWAADVWYSIKKHWALEAQRLIRARHAAFDDGVRTSAVQQRTSSQQ